VQLNGGLTLCFSLTDQNKMCSAILYNSCMASPAVWVFSADSSRLEVQLHWRLCRRTCSASHWWVAYKPHPSASWASVSDEATVISRVAGSIPRQRLVDEGGDLELCVLPHWKPVT